MSYVMCGSKSVDSNKYVEAVTLDLLMPNRVLRLEAMRLLLVG